ncbi:MAG: sulfotransferase [Pseudomonadota bacterium]|nr:sulfotransferase [Pseudomonadota bacterium]
MRRSLPDLFATGQLLAGMELGAWRDTLCRAHWKVDPAYVPRAAWITALGAASTLAARAEDARFGRAIASVEIDPSPLFVLGHWRSGTTHLQNCIGRMPDYTCPTTYQVVFPGSFLGTRELVGPLTAGLLPETRGYDNVKMGWDEAAEDEIALAKLTGLSPYLGAMFPADAPRYERYIDFLEAAPDEVDAWKDALRYFVKKLMYAAKGRQVVLKSCAHTARIRLLLQLWPDARFVFIHRHPYRVFASTLHLRAHTDWENFFQVPREGWEEERARQTLALGERIFDRYLADRALIPAGQLAEIGYDDLVADEVGVLGEVFATLGLQGWERGEPALRAYLAGVGPYTRNALALDERDRARVDRAWESAFTAFGYSRDGGW